MVDTSQSPSPTSPTSNTLSLHLVMTRMLNLLYQEWMREAYRSPIQDRALPATQQRSERLRRLGSSPLLLYVVLLQGLLNGDDLLRLLQALSWAVRVRYISMRLPIPNLGLEVSPVKFELTLVSTLHRGGVSALAAQSAGLGMSSAQRYLRHSRRG
jgi:hypothetical protein